MLFVVSIFFFFKQKTAYEMRISDWSSDVCSSDLRRQVVTSPVGIADRRLLLILGTLTIGLLAASEMTRPWRQDGISVGDAAMFLLLFSLYAWIAFGFLNALAGFLGLAANCLSPLFPDYGLPLPRRRDRKSVV